MAHLFQTFMKDGTPHPFWRIEYRDWEGRKRKRTGSRSKAETIRLASRIEAEQKEIRLGLRPPPKPSDAPRDFSKVVEEYLGWGNMQGGRGGRPWAERHSQKRKAYLAWWQKKLKLRFLSDLRGCQPRVEKALRDLKEEGLAGKTLSNYAESLAAFCDWCVEREYLESDPLKRLTRIDVTPIETRRALTRDEITRLLSVAPPVRRLLYEVAFCTGLRRNELAKLTVGHLDLERGGLQLDAVWTKNRKAGFQPLPKQLVDKLAMVAAGKRPDAPLLEVPTHAARALDLDLEAAGIPKWIDGVGKIDFHACRVAYSTLVVEAGANVKEAHTLLRHSTPQLTMDVYTRTRDERLSQLADSVGQMVLNRGHASAPTVPQADSEPTDDGVVSADEDDELARHESQATPGFDSPRLHDKSKSDNVLEGHGGMFLIPPPVVDFHPVSPCCTRACGPWGIVATRRVRQWCGRIGSLRAAAQSSLHRKKPGLQEAHSLRSGERPPPWTTQ